MVHTLIVGLKLLITKGREQVPVIHVDVCMRTTQVNSPITYDFTFHVHILLFHWDFFIFYFMRRQQIVNIATRGTMSVCDRTTQVK